MFGKNTTSNSLFGNVNTSTPTSTPASSQQMNPNAAGSMFSQNKTGLFGNVTQNNNIGTSTPSPSSGLFSNDSNNGTQTGGGLFGNSATAQAQPAASGLFGNSAAQPASGGLFGNTNRASSTQPATGGLFGTANKSTTQPAAGGLFGANNTNASQTTTGGLFGNNSTTQNFTGGLFGSKPTAPATSGLFGNSNNTVPSSTAGGLFGSKIAAPTTAGGSLFGNSNTTASGGLFSNPTTTNTIPTTTTTNTSTGLFGATNAQSAMNGGLFGNSTNNNTLLPGGIPQNSNPFGINIANASNPIVTMPNSITASLDKKENIGGANSLNDSTSNTIPKRSFSISSNSSSNQPPVTKVPQSNLFSKLSSRLNMTKHHSTTNGIFSQSWSNTNILNANNTLFEKGNTTDSSASLNPSNKLRTDFTALRNLKIDSNRSAAKKIKLFSGKAKDTKQTELYEPRREDVILEDGNKITENHTEASNEKVVTTAVKEDKASICDESDKFSDYWCLPSIESLNQLSPSQLSAVPNFIVGRKGYGNISFNYDVDLTEFQSNLRQELFGKTVIFHNSKTVEVYPEGSAKPAVGDGLNVPATITLENIYPIDKKTKKPIILDTIKSNQAHILIQKLKNMRDMEFISYNPFGGIWTFKVNHFSIWGLVDEEDIEIDEEEVESLNSKQQSATHQIIEQNGRNLAQSNQNIFNDISSVSESSKQLVPLNEDIQMMKQTLLNEGFIDEKYYEPNVEDYDFEGLQAEPDLNTSQDWVEQLKLAGLKEKSIFINTENLQSDQKRITNFFENFDKDVKLEQQIKNDLKLNDEIPLVSFQSNGSIIEKNKSSESGVSSFFPTTELAGEFNIQHNLLDQHISSSIISNREEIPYPQIDKFSVKFRDILSILPSGNSIKDVCSLCSILFDPLTEKYNIEEESVREVLLKNQKYSSLCSWLVTQYDVEIQYKIRNATCPLDRVFYYLMLNDVFNASKVAIESQNKHLAVLLTYLGSNDPSIRELSSLQLDTWESTGRSIDSKIIRIYQLLSGDLFSNSNPNQLNKLLDEFSWLSVFGLSIIYGQIDEYSLEDLVNKNILLISEPNNDLCYAILKLFGMEGGIDAFIRHISCNISSDILSIQFLWYLVQLLKLGEHRYVSNELADEVTFRYIEELKLSNCFKEALYVSLFINENKTAQQQIDSIVFQNIPSLWEEEINEDYIEKLHIPMSLINKSLSLSEKYKGNHIQEVEYLLRANLFTEAVKVISIEVGPQLILQYNASGDKAYLNTLYEFISRIPRDEIRNYEQTLAIFSTFIDIMTGKKSSKNVIETLQSNIKLFHEANKHYRIVPACCDIIQKKVTYQYE